VSNNIFTFSRQRKAGVLLHPTSLPGELLGGDIGHQAYRFIEFLKSSGFKVWQMLPLGPTHDDKSPYQCLSSHAGNPLLISLDWLEDKNWLNTSLITISKSEETYRKACLEQAADFFYQLTKKSLVKEISDFKKEHKYWIEDYALFMAFKNKYNNKPWYEWPASIRHRDKKALEAARTELKKLINQIVFEQFIFFKQWHEIRRYAKDHDVQIFGDMPIFVARDSADVWAQRQNFLMDTDGEMEFVAGVPPDAFSETGQRWGNPLYDWEYMKTSQFDWWKQRFSTQLELFDIVRIDHFRGLQACWQIPNEDDIATNGKWAAAPGRELLDALFSHFHHLPLVAEDLGVITEDVIELKNTFKLPGMKVLQFAFDGNNSNPHLPHCHETNDLVYTGTHDNDTTLGWLGDESNYDKEFFISYLHLQKQTVEDYTWTMIRTAMSSVSFLCVLPLQDLLMLDSSGRMNTPGTTGGNWSWRFEWSQLKPDVREKILHLLALYQR